MNEDASTNVPVLVEDAAADDLSPQVPVGLDPVGHVVHWNQSPSFTGVAALMEPEAEVKPGQFLGVWHGRRGISVLTVVQVSNSFEVNPNEEPRLAAAREALGLGRQYAGEGVSTRIFRLAECATVEEFDVSETSAVPEVRGEGRAPQTLCRSGDPVVLLPPEIVVAAIGGRSSPDMGISLGDTFGTAAAPVVLKPEAFQLHLGVFGNPGKGKSYLVGNLLEEARQWGIPALVLDVNGEMIDAARDLGGLVITLPDPARFGISLSLMTPRELVEITPNVQPNTIYAELIELAHDQLRSELQQGSNAQISFDDLRGRIVKLGESTKAPKTSIGAAIARVTTLQSDPLVGTAFDFVDKLIKHQLVVLDCRFISLRQTRLIAAAAARELQRIGREMGRRAAAGDTEGQDWFALYFVDEAHAIVPDDEHVVSTQVHFELARMGRHVRTGLVLSSQSPQDLNTSVLKRLQTRFVFALEKDQLRSIQGVIADLDERILQQLPKLPRGICAVSGTSEVVRHGFLLSVRKRETSVGGRTPPVFERRAKSSIEEIVHR